MIPADEKGFYSEHQCHSLSFLKDLASAETKILLYNERKVKSQQSLQMKPRAADSIYSTS